MFLVGHAGIGKTRAIRAAMEFIQEIPELHLGATSMTMASLVDHMNEAKRTIVNLPNPIIEYNSLLIGADELSAFMDQFDTGLIAGLTTFYDVVPYSQGRRVKDIRIKIARPQLNILCGTTPSNLVRFIPEFAWEQGFTSRILMIYSSEQPIIDVFNTPKVEKPKDMIYDLKVINSLVGEFGWSNEFATAMHNWKLLGYEPRPKHPKLEHYNTRRFGHMLKLCMVASVDRSSALQLEIEDFNRAAKWLLEAESWMPDIFTSGVGSADSKAMDEVLHYIEKYGPKGISEHQVVNMIRSRIVQGSQAVNILKTMEAAGMIKATMIEKATGNRIFVAMPKS